MPASGLLRDAGVRTTSMVSLSQLSNTSKQRQNFKGLTSLPPARGSLRLPRREATEPLEWLPPASLSLAAPGKEAEAEAQQALMGEWLEGFSSGADGAFQSHALALEIHLRRALTATEGGAQRPDAFRTAAVCECLARLPQVAGPFARVLQVGRSADRAAKWPPSAAAAWPPPAGTARDTPTPRPPRVRRSCFGPSCFGPSTSTSMPSRGDRLASTRLRCCTRPPSSPSAERSERASARWAPGSTRTRRRGRRRGRRRKGGRTW